MHRSARGGAGATATAETVESQEVWLNGQVVSATHRVDHLQVMRGGTLQFLQRDLTPLTDTQRQRWRDYAGRRHALQTHEIESASASGAETREPCARDETHTPPPPRGDERGGGGGRGGVHNHHYTSTSSTSTSTSSTSVTSWTLLCVVAAASAALATVATQLLQRHWTGAMAVWERQRKAVSHRV